MGKEIGEQRKSGRKFLFRIMLSRIVGENRKIRGDKGEEVQTGFKRPSFKCSIH